MTYENTSETESLTREIREINFKLSQSQGEKTTDLTREETRQFISTLVKDDTRTKEERGDVYPPTNLQELLLILVSKERGVTQTTTLNGHTQGRLHDTHLDWSAFHLSSLSPSRGNLTRSRIIFFLSFPF